MRVAFDFDLVASNRFSGLYAYGAGLLKGFGKLAVNLDAKLVYSRRFGATVSQLKVDYPNHVKLKMLRVNRRYLEKIWSYSKYPALQWLIGSFDIYHCLYNLMTPTAGKPRILTVHDLRRYKVPQLYEKTKTRQFDLAVRQADHFIAVSQSTKNDLCETFGIPRDKVDVTYLAADEKFSLLPEVEKKRLKMKFAGQMKTSLDRFVITITTTDRRKNTERIIRAFKMASAKLPKGTKLVLVGTPQRYFEGPNLCETDADQNIVRAGPVENLAEWLGCADALVYAGLYEGFGIPILEAFASGVPVITSNCSSMPEVAGEAALTVNPYDEKSISEAIVGICNNDELRRRLICSGIERNRGFDWTKTAGQTLDVYRKLL
jgi:glycosyltransferase involved in cell wall biosynthesis